jgi:hypothetical protein
VLLDAQGDVLLALTRKHFLSIARFHLARVSFGDAAPADR